MSENMTFEGHLAALEAAVAALREGLPLEVALARFEEGAKHAAACDEILEQARQRIRVLCADDNCADYETGETTA